MTSLKFQVCLLGDSGVGKTSLIRQFTDNTFRESNGTTVSDFRITTIMVKANIVELLIWDTSGSERYRSLTRSYYRAAHGIIIVYDVTNEASFRNLPIWLDEIDKNAEENVSKLLVGNKCDLVTQRMVNYSMGKRFANAHQMNYVETSAKNAENVDTSFVAMASEILQQFEMNSPESLEPNGAFRMGQNDPNEQGQPSNRCCGGSSRRRENYIFLEEIEAPDKLSDVTLEICLVGNLGVGKSSLLERFANDRFSKGSQCIGVDVRNININEKMKSGNCNFERRAKTKIKVWDTMGALSYRSMMFQYISRSQGIIIVYDTTMKSTFTSVRYWLDKIDQYAKRNVSKLLVGTKSDLTNRRAVDYDEAQELAASLLIPFLETSALDGSNVHEVFLTVTSQIKEQLRRGKKRI